VRATIASVRDLDASYLAVQGPPGTGKTYLASHVIRELVEQHQWKIGVVAQSHKVVENVLRTVVAAGVSADLVAKAAPNNHAESYVAEPFTELPANGHARLAADHDAEGYVIGGTAWDFTNLKRVVRDQLDLLVIDEAGQFSLAPTIAVSVAARNLLLLGDPQQLPQVSQGTHPAPVDQSALGYVADGQAVLPPEFGYFLAESWRMHSAVTAPVSRLSYEGALRSNPTADERKLDGITPGLHAIALKHCGNSTHSPEEAERVVALVTSHLGRAWNDGTSTRPLGEPDVIVVTPYNAQVETIRTALDAAGLHHVRAGTVDKFQGQEAAISIVSLAASSAADVPRGLSFLLSRNRLNVGISRAQWAAYLVYSPELLDYLPPSAAEIADLSRFMRLVARG
jgi:superfamily I DNA and/or RNA helicase